MFLRQAKQKNGKIYLSIVQSYRTPEGKNRSKTIKSLGLLDKLQEQYDDPIAYFKAECERMNEEATSENEPIVLKFSPNKKIDKRKENFIDLGAAVVLKYMQALGIERFFDNRRKEANFNYNPCRILELLTYDRIAHQSSKKRAWESRESFPRKCDFTLDDVYRSLDYLDKHTKKLVAAINDSIESKWGPRNLESIYYDVTNYYFECDPDEGLRREGCSKEHRPNPIVQMGLMIDSEGIPINYDIFPGNTNDCLTMMPVMRDLRRRHDERVIVVADKGLNTSDNIAACILDGNGYVFSQSVRKADRSLQEWVLDDADYDIRDEFKVKSKLCDKSITIRDKSGKVIGHEDVPVRIVAFWSADYDRRAKAQRVKAIDKASRMVANQASYEHAKKYGAARYVHEVFVDEKTGECQKSVISIDEEAIAKDERFDGYYCLITSEEQKTPEEIIDIYRGLWKIEESFRVMKGDFDARPVHVSTDAHIRAHFLICYISLLITRLIQRDTKHRYSASQIASAIAGLRGTYMEENYYLFGYRDDVTDALGKATGMNLAKKIYSKGEITSLIASVKNAR